MAFEGLQHRVTTASALALLLIASPSYAQTVSPATRESPMTSQLQSTTPPSAQPRAAAEDTALRPFRIHVPEAELRQRIMATRWPDKETVADHSQGVPLAMVREGGFFDAKGVSIPVAVTVFPVDKGGHFAAWEQPQLFAAELRAAFRVAAVARRRAARGGRR